MVVATEAEEDTEGSLPGDNQSGGGGRIKEDSSHNSLHEINIKYLLIRRKAVNFSVKELKELLKVLEP